MNRAITLRAPNVGLLPSQVLTQGRQPPLTLPSSLSVIPVTNSGRSNVTSFKVSLVLLIDLLHSNQHGSSIAGAATLAHRFIPRRDPDHKLHPNQIFCDSDHISWNFSV